MPAGNQSPFPIAEPPHNNTSSAASTTTAAATDAVGQGISAVQQKVGPLADKATKFARERPYATAALVGTIALAVFNSLRGRRG